MMKRLVCLFAAVAACACGSAPEKTASDEPKTFRMIEVPALLATPEERAEYVARNYWKNFDFSDTAYIRLSEVTEQAFADYVAVLGQLPPDLAAVSVRTTLSGAEADTAMFAYFTELFDKYLYDPNSPVRNEEIYIPVLEYIVASDKVSETDKVRPRYRLGMALKNRPGTPAADFTYTLASGATGTLYGVKADYLILFINNPGCTACKETIERIASSELISEQIARGRVKVLAVYPDEDLAAWRDYRSHIPAEWINGYDAQRKMSQDELYDLKAIPTLYLLSSDKKVILKDVPAGVVERYLAGVSGGR